MLDPLQFYCRVLCNGMKTRFRMVMIAHPGPGIGFHKRFMWRIIIPPTTSITMDFIGPFPKSLDSNYLWVIVCCLTSQVHLVPIKTTTNALELTYEFLKNVVHLHRLPKSIVSDRDSKFMSKFWTELHHLLRVRLKMTTSFHPQGDGQAEWTIQTIVQIIWVTIHLDQQDWVLQLPMTEFALNSSANKSKQGMPPLN